MLDFPANGIYKNFKHDGVAWQKTRSRQLERGVLDNLAEKILQLPLKYRSFQLRLMGMTYIGGVGQPTLQMGYAGYPWDRNAAGRWMCHYETQIAGPTASVGQTTGINSRGAILVAGMAPASDAASSGMAIIDIDPGNAFNQYRPTVFVVGTANFPTAYHQMYLGWFQEATIRLAQCRIVAHNGTSNISFKSGNYTLIGYE